MADSIARNCAVPVFAFVAIEEKIMPFSAQSVLAAMAKTRAEKGAIHGFSVHG
jgi:hypothetical protein